jgi:hypothetical protein
MSHLLRIFGERQANVPLEKVFALVGMAKKYSTDLKQLVDYRQEAQDIVLLNLANLLLDNREALDVFEVAGIGWNNHSPKLPSWAVDWTVTRSGMPLPSKFSPPAVQYCATADIASG